MAVKRAQRGSMVQLPEFVSTSSLLKQFQPMGLAVNDAHIKIESSPDKLECLNYFAA